MRAKLVYENIEFERGLEPRDAMNIGLGRTERDIRKALKDLKELGIDVETRGNGFNPNIIELMIPELKNHQVSYLPEEERFWRKGEIMMGWGIYELDDGEMIIDGKPWEETLAKIKKLLNI